MSRQHEPKHKQQQWPPYRILTITSQVRSVSKLNHLEKKSSMNFHLQNKIPVISESRYIVRNLNKLCLDLQAALVASEGKAIQVYLFPLLMCWPLLLLLFLKFEFISLHVIQFIHFPQSQIPYCGAG